MREDDMSLASAIVLFFIFYCVEKEKAKMKPCAFYSSLFVALCLLHVCLKLGHYLNFSNAGLIHHSLIVVK